MFIKSINYKTVSEPEDFLLFSLKNKNEKIDYKSDFFSLAKDKKSLILRTDIDNLYPEIYLEFTLKISNLSSLMKEEVILAEGKCKTYDGWKLYIDRYGYLMFTGPGKKSSLRSNSKLSLSSFVDKSFKVGFALNNSAFTSRKTKHWKEAVAYNRLLLMVSKNENSGMKIHFTVERFKERLLSPVPETIEIPLINSTNAGIAITQILAYNTARYELFSEKHKNPSKCIIESNFSGASKFFPVYDDAKDLIDIYTGPEFCITTSYWIFARVKGAEKNKTRLRIHLSIGHGTPNMAPVFFWSRDRKNWFRMDALEVTNDRGIFYPLLLAPERDFYLSSSIPFMETELKEVIENVKDMPFVEVINIGKTVEKRDIKLFKITDPSIKDSDKKNILITVGQHSPQEMLGGHFLMPIIDYFKKNPKLLKEVALYFVPIVNMDCAHWGGNGLNVNKQNTNRCWFKNLQPETIGIRNYFKYLKKQGINLDYFIDIHAGGTWKNHVILRYPDSFYKKPFRSTSSRLIQKKNQALKLLEEYAGLRIIDGMDFGFRNCSARDYFRMTYSEAVTFDLELGTSSYFDPIKKESMIVDQKSLSIVGEGLLKSLLAFLELQ
ncbi:MAG: M14 family zinc carboxypeptidase [bacterium]